MDHLWLPSLGVWAQKPCPASSSRSPPTGPAEGDEEGPSSSSSSPCEKKDESHHQTQQPACPICLSPFSDSNLAVLWWCMHRFCVDCIRKWSLMQRFCPLCRQTFHGWYYNIRSPSEFCSNALPSVAPSPKISSQTSHRRYYNRRAERPTSIVSYKQSQPLRWRRSFGASSAIQSGNPKRSVESKSDEALRWRASIYRRGLRAVPQAASTLVKQASAIDSDRKARIERRLEPWVRRELEAITGDLDPSLVVHFVLSLWFVFLEKKERTEERARSNEDFGETEAINQLKPFLDENAPTFWHEMRCFAESPYSLGAYDCVTVYQKNKN